MFFISLFISKKFKIANIISYIGFYYASFIGIIVFNIHHLFSFLIVDILHKDITLSGRDPVWTKFKGEIVKSPILGIGYQQDSLWFPPHGKSKGKYLYAHNHILQELYNGGIVMYLIYIWFVILPAKKLWKNKDNSLTKVFSSIILAILVHSLCESVSIAVFTLIYTLAYHVEDFIYSNNNKSSERPVNE